MVFFRKRSSFKHKKLFSPLKLGNAQFSAFDQLGNEYEDESDDESPPTPVAVEKSMTDIARMRSRMGTRRSSIDSPLAASPRAPNPHANLLKRRHSVPDSPSHLTASDSVRAVLDLESDAVDDVTRFVTTTPRKSPSTPKISVTRIDANSPQSSSTPRKQALNKNLHIQTTDFDTPQKGPQVLPASVASPMVRVASLKETMAIRGQQFHDDDDVRSPIGRPRAVAVEYVRDALAKMHCPTPFLKYCRKAFPHYRNFYLSDDNQFLCWESSVKAENKTRVPISNISNIILGQRTLNFERHPSADLERFSFSIMYRPKATGKKFRSLDLVSLNVKDFQIFVKGLQFLMKLSAEGGNEALSQCTEVPCKIVLSQLAEDDWPDVPEFMFT